MIAHSMALFTFPKPLPACTPPTNLQTAIGLGLEVGYPEEIESWPCLIVQVTTAVFISSRFNSAVVTCANKLRTTPHFLSLLDNQPEAGL